MKTKFTTGPWEIGVYHTTPEFQRIDQHVCVMKSDSRLLLAVTGPVVDEEISYADAHLIAASPDLYFAARQALDVMPTGPEKDALIDALLKADGG